MSRSFHRSAPKPWRKEKKWARKETNRKVRHLTHMKVNTRVSGDEVLPQNHKTSGWMTW